jgi:hypothetical protein
VLLSCPETTSQDCVGRREEYALWVWQCVQIELSLQQISVELKRMGLTRKRMRYWSMHRDEPQRVRYWVNGPFAGANGIVPNVTASAASRASRACAPTIW